MPGNPLHRHDAFMEGDMCKLRCGHHVTDCVNPWNVRLHVTVDLDVAAIHGYAESFKADAGRVRCTTCGHEKFFGDQSLALSVVGQERNLNSGRSRLCRFQPCTRMAIDSLPRENAAKLFGNLRVFQRNELRQGLQ